MTDLSAKEQKWLKHIDIATRGGGMYPGEHADFVPWKVRRSLESKGLIEGFIPHNPAHKERVVATHSGSQLARQFK